MRKCTFAFILTITFFSMSTARTDEGPDHAKQHDLAKASRNPVSSLISVPFEFNNNFNTGRRKMLTSRDIRLQSVFTGHSLSVSDRSESN